MMKRLSAPLFASLALAGMLVFDTATACCRVCVRECRFITPFQISTKVFHTLCECEREYVKSACEAAQAEAIKEVNTLVRVPHI
jgi:hypothetical protein